MIGDREVRGPAALPETEFADPIPVPTRAINISSSGLRNASGASISTHSGRIERPQERYLLVERLNLDRAGHVSKTYMERFDRIEIDLTDSVFEIEVTYRSAGPAEWVTEPSEGSR